MRLWVWNAYLVLLWNRALAYPGALLHSGGTLVPQILTVDHTFKLITKQNTVDLVIFTCLDFCEFVTFREALNSRIINFDVTCSSVIIIILFKGSEIRKFVLLTNITRSTVCDNKLNMEIVRKNKNFIYIIVNTVNYMYSKIRKHNIIMRVKYFSPSKGLFNMLRNNCTYL